MTVSPRSEAAAGHNARGNALFAEGRHADAAAEYRRALALAPERAQLHFNLGNALESAGDPAAALASFRQAIELAPGLVAAHSHLGNLLRRLDRPGEALEAYRRALYLAPFERAIRYNIGTALLDLGRAAEALPHLEHAADGAEPHIPAFASVGEALIRLGRKALALDWFRRALHHRPDDHAARFGAAVCLLARGDFAAGWEGFEARFDMPRAPGLPIAGRRLTPGDLGAIAGRHVVLMAEQGFGDTIQFCRYAPMLRALGARVTLLVQPELVRVLRGLADAAVAIGEPTDAADFVCPLMSLPFVFATRLDTIPPPAPLGRAAVARDGERVRVGLAWSGNPAHVLDHLRSIPLTMLRPLLAVPGIEFHAVQNRATPGDLPLPRALHWHGPMLGDFADTADLIAGLDLVISVDTSIAHLAASLGRPTWVLLAASADYRWLEGRDDNPWYPAARLWRQGSDGWAGVIARVLAALAKGDWR
ncbi:MAG: tetratricopeptide repeat-containing glycosyltransferase family protein [Alphaproteobacteria bacterium]|nr:tetratricopeptide repeat-containing glycosyltransferase family protein [Alphaproteobacteria bacterium]